ncbi:MAG: recombinase family protein [Paeniglutamicibacter terrestris]
MVGYARVSTNSQDLASQQAGIKTLGVPDDLVYVDHGLTGRNHERLARSLPDARDIVEGLIKRNIKLSNGSWQVRYPLAG